MPSVQKFRKELTNKQKATVFLDLKPTLTYDDLVEKIKIELQTSEKLQELKLNAAQIGL
jgi:hypothetical protein